MEATESASAIGTATLMATLVSLATAGGVMAQDIEPEGILQTIAIDSSDPTIVYAAGNGTVYRSADQGAIWTASNIGTPVWSLAVRPAGMTSSPDDGTVIVSGTQDRGALRSLDDGQTWSGDNGFTDEVRSVVVHPDGQRIFAGTATAVLASDDLGDSWRVFADFPGAGHVHGIAFDPSDPNHVYVAKFGAGVYASIDAGSSWTLSDAGLFDTQIFDLVADPSNPSSIFVATPSGVFQSVDAGATWSHLMSPSMANQLAVDPINPLRMYLVTEDTGIYRSIDGGQTWLGSSQGTRGVTAFTSIAVVSDGSGFVYAGSVADGLFISSDNGESWMTVGDFHAMPGADEPLPDETGESGGSSGGSPAGTTGTSGSASLGISITDLQNGDSVPAGGTARFRITLRNNGPDVATGVAFDPYWVQLRIIGGNDPMPFTISSSQGSCPDSNICLFGDLPVNAERTIEFSGQTEAGSLTRYRLYARAKAENAGDTERIVEISAAVTVASTGGGSIGPSLMFALILVLAHRARRRSSGGLHG
jgi:photosystem II stability/assembly factor-like uncharacterized protein